MASRWVWNVFTHLLEQRYKASRTKTTTNGINALNLRRHLQWPLCVRTKDHNGGNSWSQIRAQRFLAGLYERNEQNHAVVLLRAASYDSARCYRMLLNKAGLFGCSTCCLAPMPQDTWSESILLQWLPYLQQQRKPVETHQAFSLPFWASSVVINPWPLKTSNLNWTPPPFLSCGTVHHIFKLFLRSFFIISNLVFRWYFIFQLDVSFKLISTSFSFVKRFSLFFVWMVFVEGFVFIFFC